MEQPTTRSRVLRPTPLRRILLAGVAGAAWLVLSAGSAYADDSTATPAPSDEAAEAVAATGTDLDDMPVFTPTAAAGLAPEETQWAAAAVPAPTPVTAETAPAAPAAVVTVLDPLPSLPAADVPGSGDPAATVDAPAVPVSDPPPVSDPSLPVVDPAPVPDPALPAVDPSVPAPVPADAVPVPDPAVAVLPAPDPAVPTPSPADTSVQVPDPGTALPAVPIPGGLAAVPMVSSPGSAATTSTTAQVVAPGAVPGTGNAAVPGTAEQLGLAGRLAEFASMALRRSYYAPSVSAVLVPETPPAPGAAAPPAPPAPGSGGTPAPGGNGRPNPWHGGTGLPAPDALPPAPGSGSGSGHSSNGPTGTAAWMPSMYFYVPTADADPIRGPLQHQPAALAADPGSSPD